MTVVLRGEEARDFAERYTNHGCIDGDPDIHHLQRLEIDSSRLMFFYDERKPIIEEHNALDFRSLISAVVG